MGRLVLGVVVVPVVVVPVVVVPVVVVPVVVVGALRATRPGTCAALYRGPEEEVVAIRRLLREPGDPVLYAEVEWHTMPPPPRSPVSDPRPNGAFLDLELYQDFVMGARIGQAAGGFRGGGCTICELNGWPDGISEPPPVRRGALMAAV
ncbi:hypothetical protein CYMTET_45094 [Cymbomonas tetramitiformis]|uniref:Uncharacterized protein n=1 Tax=Cymbomonas tetramitiformis TaxID=36881 RepID=A0AAE0EYN3_9CHLO|nr:hypothetical protein CYMTET_45094 [Cymbomonas tetramitiformis]